MYRYPVLSGVSVVEIASIGPGPFCGMMLADHGARVVRVQRAGERTSGLPIGDHDFLLRGREEVEIDLKLPDGRERCLDLAADADILIEGFRPGVMERLGLGPDVCHQRNPRLVYGRMTGWGQDGPMAGEAGHDINYIAASGALHAIGEAGGDPVVPLNLIADYAGGGMLLAFGVMAALNGARTTGRGAVVDAAMLDGVAITLSLTRALRNAGRWSLQRGDNILDGGAPYYAVYRAADGRHLAVGALEPQFWTRFAEGIGLAAELAARRDDKSVWPDLKAEIARLIAGRTSREWMERFQGRDACVTAVLDLDEAVGFPQAKARGSYVDGIGGSEPAPAPRIRAV